MRLEHQHAGQTAHPVDIREPGLRRRIHRWLQARGQYTKQRRDYPRQGDLLKRKVFGIAFGLRH